MNRGTVNRLAAIAAALLAAPQAAHGGGLFAGEAGAQAQARAGAFVAKADDATALMHNPAGLVKARRYEVYLGVNLTSFDQSFQRAGTYPDHVDGAPYDHTHAYEGQAFGRVENEGSVQPIPMIAATQRFGRFALGEGLFAPSAYPNRDYTRYEPAAGNLDAGPAPQRYDVVKQESLMAFPSIAGAYRVLPGLDVGLRVSWGFGGLKAKSYTWGFENTEENVDKDAVFDVDVSDAFLSSFADFAPVFGAGVLYRPTDSIEIGFAYSSEVNMQATGTGTADLGPQLGIPVGMTFEESYIEPLQPEDRPACQPGKIGTVGALYSCLDLKVPQYATLAGRWILRDGRGAERADVELDVRWEDWSAASDITVVVDGKDKATNFTLNPAIIRHGFEDVYSVRLGGHYRLDLGAGALDLMAGVAYDTAAAPDSWQRLDMDGAARTTFAGGVAWVGRSFRVDVGGALILEGDRDVTQVTLSDTGPVALREQPDPVQPLVDPSGQVYDPINNGRFESGYVMGAIGISGWF